MILKNYEGLVFALTNKIFWGLTEVQKNTIDRDDLIQEGWVAMLEDAEKYDSKLGQFSTFIYPRIRGAMLDFCRKTFKGNEVTIDDFSEFDFSGDISKDCPKGSALESMDDLTEVEKEELFNNLNQAMDILTSTEKIILIFRMKEGWPLRKVSEYLNVPIPTIARWQDKFLLKMRNFLEKKGWGIQNVTDLFFDK